VLGASGMILTVRDVVRAKGWSDDGISLASLQRLRAGLISRGHIDKLGCSCPAAMFLPVAWLF